MSVKVSIQQNPPTTSILGGYQKLSINKSDQFILINRQSKNIQSKNMSISNRNNSITKNIILNITSPEDSYRKPNNKNSDEKDSINKQLDLIKNNKQLISTMNINDMKKLNSLPVLNNIQQVNQLATLPEIDIIDHKIILNLDDIYDIINLYKASIKRFQKCLNNKLTLKGLCENFDIDFENINLFKDFVDKYDSIYLTKYCPKFRCLGTCEIRSLTEKKFELSDYFKNTIPNPPPEWGKYSELTWNQFDKETWLQREVIVRKYIHNEYNEESKRYIKVTNLRTEWFDTLANFKLDNCDYINRIRNNNYMPSKALFNYINQEYNLISRYKKLAIIKSL